jgi:hypothetical protein
MINKPDMPNTPTRFDARPPPLCYSRPRAAEEAANHTDSIAALTTLTVVTAAVLWLMVYSGFGF